MPFITDRDLLALQPSLLREVSWLAQTLHRGTVKIESGKLVAVTGAFSPAVSVGHIALAGEQPLEITSITSSTNIGVSLTRAVPDAPIIAPADTGNLPGVIATFDPQIALVHDQLLRMFGLEPSRQALDPDAPTEAAILNPRDLRLVESVGVLHLVYAAAGAALAADDTLAARAALFRLRFAEERARARAIIDTNGDGRADAIRTLSVARFSRA